MLDSARKVNYFSIRPSKKRKKDLHNNGIEPEIQSLLFIDWLLFFGWEFVASPSTHTPSSEHYHLLLFLFLLRIIGSTTSPSALDSPLLLLQSCSKYIHNMNSIGEGGGGGAIEALHPLIVSLDSIISHRLALLLCALNVPPLPSFIGHVFVLFFKLRSLKTNRWKTSVKRDSRIYLYGWIVTFFLHLWQVKRRENNEANNQYCGYCLCCRKTGVKKKKKNTHTHLKKK